MDDEVPFFLCGAFEMDAAADQGDEGMNGAGCGAFSLGSSKPKRREIDVCSCIFLA